MGDLCILLKKNAGAKSWETEIHVHAGACCCIVADELLKIVFRWFQF